MGRRKNNNGLPYVKKYGGKPAVYWYNESGKQRRKVCSSDDEAASFRNEKEKEVQGNLAFQDTGLRRAHTSLPQDKIHDAENAFAMLSNNGYGNTNLVDAVAYFLDHYQDPESTPYLTAFIDDFITRKEGANRSEKTLSQFKTNLNQFARFCGQKQVTRLHEISTPIIEQYLDDLMVRPLTGSRKETVEASSQTKSNRLQNIRTLMNAAIKRGHIQFNPATPIDDYDVTRKPKAFFSIKEVLKLLKRAHEEGMLAHYYFRLATMFRDLETTRFTNLENYWSHIDLRAGQILLPASCCKTQRDKKKGGRRITISTQPNFAAFLKAFKKRKMSLAKDPHKERKLFAELKKDPLERHNIVRDTAISLHARFLNSVFDTAQEAGNSEEMINAHYLVIYNPADAKKFFALKPSDFGL